MNGGDGDGLQKTPLTALAVLYPPEALASHIEGDVLLSGVIGRDGKVRDVKVISGHPVLAVAAMNVVMQWQYKPYTFYGEAVEVETTIKVSFHLKGRH